MVFLLPPKISRVSEQAQPHKGYTAYPHKGDDTLAHGAIARWPLYRASVGFARLIGLVLYFKSGRGPRYSLVLRSKMANGLGCMLAECVREHMRGKNSDLGREDEERPGRGDQALQQDLDQGPSREYKPLICHHSRSLPARMKIRLNAEILSMCLVFQL